MDKLTIETEHKRLLKSYLKSIIYDRMNNILKRIKRIQNLKTYKEKINSDFRDYRNYAHEIEQLYREYDILKNIKIGDDLNEN